MWLETGVGFFDTNLVNKKWKRNIIVLTETQSRNCYDQIKESSLESLKLSLYRQALDYAQVRSQWQLMTLEQRKEIDPRRTMVHNAFIDSANILSRNMTKQGEDNSWREVLGDDRKVIGDFACYVALFLALEAR